MTIQHAKTIWSRFFESPLTVGAGQMLARTSELRLPEPMLRLFHYLFAVPLCGEVIEQLAEIEELSPGWRQLFRRRIDSHSVEEWKYRLTTP